MSITKHERKACGRNLDCICIKAGIWQADSSKIHVNAEMGGKRVKKNI